LTGLPGWPRWLSAEQAAAYVGVSEIWPKVKKRGFGKMRDGRLTWGPGPT
jgi:hypothetical protein